MIYSIAALGAHPMIQLVVLVVPAEKRITAAAIIRRHHADPAQKIVLISGGSTRQQSALCAMRYLHDLPQRPDYVLFHDAARPLITRSSISAVVNAAKTSEASVLAGNAIDLTFEVVNGIVRKAHDRVKTFSGYTPQCFAFKTLWNAHQKEQCVKRAAGASSLDNIELILRHAPRLRIAVVHSRYPSYKLTHRRDRIALDALLVTS